MAGKICKDERSFSHVPLLWGCVSGCLGEVGKMQLYRVMPHFNRNNKPIHLKNNILCPISCCVAALGNFVSHEKALASAKLKVVKGPMAKNKVWGSPGGMTYHIIISYILWLQRLISREKKRSNLTWNGPVYHSYIQRLHFVHQSLLWCLISLVTQERPALHIIKDW